MNSFFIADAATSAAPATTTTTTTQPADSGAPTPPQQAGNMTMPIAILIMIALFYFMMIRPQNRREKERRKMLSELRAGAKVVFAGGLIGTIVEAKEKTFKIEIAGDVVIEVARGAVQGLASEETEAAK